MVRKGIVVLGALVLLTVPSIADQSFVPSASRAKELVASKRTREFITVREALAYAERMRPDIFKVDRVRSEHREGEPFTRVQICYQLGLKLSTREPKCGIEYRVTDDPPAAELSDTNASFARPLQDSRARFIAAIDRDVRLQGDPIGQALHWFGDATTP